ncbi:MEDS domain-containing protein [Dactylosporangium sp. NPDC050588]|uniref:MEDS domain-containing protein n=1 Tax=Dactylosporangium sp. NPDC050588 TaxID=3157211 RepID=UPI0033CA6F4F
MRPHISIVLAAALVLPTLAVAGPPASAATASITYEAESGTLQGVTVADAVPGFSGTGYVAGFDDPADTAGQVTRWDDDGTADHLRRLGRRCRSLIARERVTDQRLCFGNETRAAHQVTAAATAKHSCWSYEDQRQFEASARTFLAEGLAAGERIWYARAGGPGGLGGWLDEAARAHPGAVRFVPLEEAYLAGQRLDPSAQVGTYTAATATAVADGYAGLRVVAECTPLVDTPDRLSSFAAYETLVDRFIATAPMRAVCGFDRGTLGDRAVAEVACLHPASNAGGVYFTLRAGPPGGPAAILAGELDVAAEELFPAALAHVRPEPTGGTIVFDAAGLRFVDHRALLQLHRYAERAGADVVLRTSLGIVTELAAMVGAGRVRVERVQ